MKYEMSFRHALEVLIQSAQRDIDGQGCGIRSTSNEWREKVEKAIHRVKLHIFEWYREEQS